jgi:hypothetical protein
MVIIIIIMKGGMIKWCFLVNFSEYCPTSLSYVVPVVLRSEQHEAVVWTTTCTHCEFVPCRYLQPDVFVVLSKFELIG